MTEQSGRVKPRFPWLTSYWQWAIGGSRWRLAAALGGPVFILLIVLAAIFEEDPEEDALGVVASPAATLAAAASSPATSVDSATRTASPTPETQAGDPPGPTATQKPTPEPSTYTVQAGDSLNAICSQQLPNIPLEECVSEIVALNGLANAGQLALEQELLLPSDGALGQQATATATQTSVTAAEATNTSSLSATATIQPAATAVPGLPTALVIRVIDGDTVELEGGARVRYTGIDTPESTSVVECYGPEATARNRQLVEGLIVELETDISETDRFGRLLRYVYVNGVMVNELLVREGFAKVTTFPPDVRYEALFLAAQQQAQASGAGLWSACQAPEPTVTPTQTSGQGDCDPAYPTICVPSPPPDLNCGDIPQYSNFDVLPPDPHNFDGDNDGKGCEGN